MEIPADLLAPLAPFQDVALELELMTAPAPLLEQLVDVLLAPVRQVTAEIELEPRLLQMWPLLWLCSWQKRGSWCWSRRKTKGHLQN